MIPNEKAPLAPCGPRIVNDSLKPTVSDIYEADEVELTDSSPSRSLSPRALTDMNCHKFDPECDADVSTDADTDSSAPVVRFNDDVFFIGHDVLDNQEKDECDADSSSTDAELSPSSLSLTTTSSRPSTPFLRELRNGDVAGAEAVGPRLPAACAEPRRCNLGTLTFEPCQRVQFDAVLKRIHLLQEFS